MSEDSEELIDQRRHFERRRTFLRNARNNWVKRAQDIAQYILPEYDRFEGRGTGKRGDPDFSKILDNTATQAAEIAGTGLMSVTSNPAREWAGLMHPDPQLSELEEVRAWTQELTSAMLQDFARSNVYRALPKVMLELPVFGTAVMFVMEDSEDVIRCQNFPPGEYYLAQDARGVVNVCYRDFTMTVEQLVGEFGKDNLSLTTLQRLKDGHVDQEITVTHAVEPMTNKLPLDVGLPPEAKFRSVYFEANAKVGDTASNFLRVGGFFEFPVMAPRWVTVGTDVYGFGRGHKCLADVKQLQFQTSAKAEAIEKQVNPPLKRPAGMDTGKMNTLPGGISTYDYTMGGDNAIGALYKVNLDIGSVREDIAVLHDRIERDFYVDVFTLLTNLDKGQVTAREVDELREEKVLRLGGVSQNMDEELFDPLIDRWFGIKQRRGEIPDAPESIQGDPLRVEYFTILHHIQKAQGLGSIERLIATVGNISALRGDLEPWDKIDTDRAIEDIAARLGTPVKQILPDDVVADKREQRQRQIQLQQMTSMAKEGAEATKAFSDSSTEGENVLSAAMAGAARR